MEDPCCAPEAAAWAADAEACDALACDPTLEACCRRDLEAQAVEARLKAQLSLADRSKERQRLAARVLGTPAQQQQQPQQQQQGELGRDLESEEDEELMGALGSGCCPGGGSSIACASRYSMDLWAITSHAEAFSSSVELRTSGQEPITPCLPVLSRHPRPVP